MGKKIDPREFIEKKGKGLGQMNDELVINRHVRTSAPPLATFCFYSCSRNEK